MPNRFCAADNETPTLVGATVPAAVDYKRRSSSTWRSACFIIGVEIAERFAYYGISANLVSYLNGPLGQSTAAAAVNVNAWHGTVALLPLLGASVADSFLGRYRTIVMASVLYILGLSLLTLSATLPSPSSFDHCETEIDKSCSRSHLQEILFFASLYLVAVAQGGHKPCTQAFGADQFDDQDRRERNAKGSFFNWWYFSVCAGAFVTKLTVSYIQDNLSWALGFGIPCVAMGIALAVFLLGTTTYRYSTARSERSPFVRIGSVFVAAFKSRRASSSAMANEAECCSLLPQQSNEQLRFLNKALLAPNHLNEQDSRVSREAEVEEAKAVLRIVPIWATCLIYAIVHAQSTTFFTKQGATMERTIAWGFKIPAASLECFISLTMLSTTWL